MRSIPKYKDIQLCFWRVWILLKYVIYVYYLDVFFLSLLFLGETTILCLCHEFFLFLFRFWLFEKFRVTKDFMLVQNEYTYSFYTTKWALNQFHWVIDWLIHKSHTIPKHKHGSLCFGQFFFCFVGIYLAIFIYICVSIFILTHTLPLKSLRPSAIFHTKYRYSDRLETRYVRMGSPTNFRSGGTCF